MNDRIRRLGVAMLVCFAALFVMLNYVQVIRADELNADPANTRALVRDFDEPRGVIVSADGFVLAESVPSPDQFDLQRVYPEGELFAHVTGHFGLEVQSTGLERQYNNVLAGVTVEQQYRSLRDLFVDRDTTGNLELTLRRDLQVAARDALGNRRGSVVVLDPQTGEILAMWSFPSYDPNRLAAHDDDAVAEAFAELDADPAKPLLAKAYQERFFPGSTFKVVTGSAGVENDLVSEDEPDFPVVRSYTPPGTSRAISNFGGAECGGDLFELMRVSCNTGFAEMGAEVIGPDRMVQTAQAFGFNEVPPIDLPDPVASVFPVDYGAPLDSERILFEDTARLAQTSIGQNDVSATTLQMALVAAAIGNGGTVPTPHVVSEISDSDGRVQETTEPSGWLDAIEPSTADLIAEAMIVTAEAGTATPMRVPGFTVGGKTGTAQLGTDPPQSNAWVIGFAGPPGEEPTVAVAVIVEADPDNPGQTGGTVAAPIAQVVLEAALRG